MGGWPDALLALAFSGRLMAAARACGISPAVSNGGVA
jgi:hypothetical protein